MADWRTALLRRNKRRKKSNGVEAIVGVLLALFFLGIVANHAGAVFGLLLVLIFMAVGAVVLRASLRKHALAALLEKTGAAARQHMEALLRRRAQLVRLDPYGKPQAEKWSKELDYFVQQHLKPALTAAEQVTLSRNREEVLKAIEVQVAAASATQNPFVKFSDHFTPSEFETFCAETLRKHGWDARVTQQSRDQGVDVVASKVGRRVVIQCKLYSSPVGNKAVQEVAAGRAHEQADFGIVVSNNRYTAAAEELANTNRVLLLHYRDLPELEAMLAQADPH
jgi:restriction system protein